MNPRAPQVILLDWDGTLANVYPITREAINRTLRARGDLPLDEATSQIKSGLPLEITFPDPKDREYFIAEHQRLSAANPPPPMAGANELMSYLQGVRSQGVFVGVVSNKPHDLIKQEADRFGWHDMLDIIVGSDEVPKRKPNPEPLAVALKDHPQKDSLLPQKIIYIGDTNADADFAKNGGIRFFGVGDKITHDYQAQAQCKDLTQVLSRLKLLFKNPTADRSPGP